MKHDLPDWLGETLALIGAFVLFVTQAKLDAAQADVEAAQAGLTAAVEKVEARK
jgi:hypothetical protein